MSAQTGSTVAACTPRSRAASRGGSRRGGRRRWPVSAQGGHGQGERQRGAHGEPDPGVGPPGVEQRPWAGRTAPCRAGTGCSRAVARRVAGRRWRRGRGRACRVPARRLPACSTTSTSSWARSVRPPARSMLCQTSGSSAVVAQARPVTAQRAGRPVSREVGERRRSRSWAITVERREQVADGGDRAPGAVRQQGGRGGGDRGEGGRHGVEAQVEGESAGGGVERAASASDGGRAVGRRRSRAPVWQTGLSARRGDAGSGGQVWQAVGRGAAGLAAVRGQPDHRAGVVQRRRRGCRVGRPSRAAAPRAAVPAGIGRANRWPWPATQPSSQSARRCGSLSTPSATTTRSRLRPRSRVERMTAAASARGLHRRDEARGRSSARAPGCGTAGRATSSRCRSRPAPAGRPRRGAG